ncbi:MAG: argininosuccinate synthase [Phoenicibacter congonensis]|uniref:Argininosuccinate synthase n=1 Tax=Phoenicibacter congonensis TaxID=1944646 RepID=A0AA43RH38_9ACTN|nr:argininosuccinate synthase [Phoenicibacter congonensis]
MAREKSVMAYSGGLDTSVCVKWIQDEKDMDVVAVTGEVGQEHNGLEAVKQRALETGAIDAYVLDLREEFANDYLTVALAANSLYENKYPLLSALSRPLISKKLVEIAHEVGATTIVHGCTGKGNDQVRFETSIKVLDPSLKIIAPVREWDLKTRDQEMDWAEKHGIEVPTTKASPYSIDDNMWGRAIECGVLEDPWNEPPADIWTMTVDPEKAPDEAQYVEITFEQGVPVAIDGEKVSMAEAVFKMNEIAGKHGYGRLDLIEDRLVGMKSRECYECPGSLSLITAHKALETLCLERKTLSLKLNLEQEWAQLVYDGCWFSPAKAAIDAFIKNTQTCVTGTVRLKFYKGTCTVVGSKSDYSLYNYSLATYGEEDRFDQKLSKGFIDLHGLQLTTWSENRHEKHLSEIEELA